MTNGVQLARAQWQNGIFRMVLCLLVISVGGGSGLCPRQCRCNKTTDSVDCRGGRLAHFPIQLNPRVRHLQLDHNLIVDLHGSFDYYTHLRWLSLRSNRLHALDQAAFEHQSSLLLLDLRNNTIARVESEAFIGLAQLESLDLSSNRLRYLPPDVFTGLSQLIHLRLADNLLGPRLAERPEEHWILAPLHQLQLLDLAGNNLSFVPANISQLPRLTELHLQNNAFRTIPTLPAGLKYMDVSRNQLSHISDLSASLTYLNVSWNQFFAWPDELAFQIGLKVLDVGGNSLKHITAANLMKLTNLVKFYCCHTPSLTTVDLNSSKHLGNLQVLHLCNNKGLLSLEDAIVSSPALTVVNFSSNQLSVVPQPPANSKISLYDTSGNPMVCSCDVLWLREWVLEGRAVDVICASPASTERQLLSQLERSHLSCNGRKLLILVALLITLFFTLVLCVVPLLVWRYCRPKRSTTGPILPKRISSPHSHLKTAFSDPPLYLIPMSQTDRMTQLKSDTTSCRPSLTLRSTRNSSSSASACSRALSLYSATTSDSWYDMTPVLPTSVDYGYFCRGPIPSRAFSNSSCPLTYRRLPASKRHASTSYQRPEYSPNSSANPTDQTSCEAESSSDVQVQYAEPLSQIRDRKVARHPRPKSSLLMTQHRNQNKHEWPSLKRKRPCSHLSDNFCFENGAIDHTKSINVRRGTRTNNNNNSSSSNNNRFGASQSNVQHIELILR